jgi:glycosyltransferase involved in cell wall biosynthesis
MTKLLMLVSVQGDAMARDVFELCVALRDRYEILALVPTDAKRRFADAGVPVEAWRPGGFIGMGIAVSRLRRVVSKFKPDIVHAHGLPAMAVALGTFPGSLAAKTIGTFHDPQRDKELPQKLVDLKLPGYLRRARGLIATYPTLARGLEKRLALDDDSIAIVPHGVPLPLDGGALLERPGERPGPIIGWRGSLSADQSWETAIDAFALVHARYPDARLEIAGGGRARQFVAAYVREKKLASIVNFRGELGASDFFATIDVLVVPISRDAQPQAPLEALVAGVPVVAANAGALADALGFCETGWLVPDDAAGFAEGIEAAWTTIDDAWAGAARQRSAARDRFARDVVVRAYVDAYETTGMPRPA